MTAYAALLLWPVVALGLYLSMPVGRATIWTLLAGYLILPIVTSFDFPGIPSLDKSSIPSLAAFVLAPLMSRSREFRWPRSKFVNLLMLVYVLVPFGTAMNNPDPIVVGATTLPGLGFREGLAAAAGNVITLIPFVLGAALLGNAKGHRDVLMALVLAALAYSLPIIFELRMSPSLQGWIYGVSQEGMFMQQVRGGGYRASVFLGHGLLVSTFLVMALVASIGLTRVRAQLFTVPMGLVAGYLAAVLVLNKSVGALFLGLAFGPLLFVMAKRQFVSMAFLLSLLVLTYPFVRGADILPISSAVESVRSLSAERAESLEFRLRNEDLLLRRAQERPWFGWGSYGRNRVLVVTSWGATQDVSVTDGTWVITIGVAGWLGYLASFGLLTYPVWRAFRLRRLGLPMATVTLIAVHLVNLLDLIPNSSLRPFTWLLAGAVASMRAASLGLSRPMPRAVERRDAEVALPEPAVPA